MRIGVLCNSKWSIPSVQFLVQSGHQVFVMLPEEIHPDHAELGQLTSYFQLPVQRLQKNNIDSELLFWQAQNQLDFIFVITFPYILSKAVIQSLSSPIINFHFAPLPEYKGAQPVFWMIKNGEKRGGIAAHLITEEIDGGPIVSFEPYTLSKYETYGSYLSKMAALNPKVIQSTLSKISKDNWKSSVKAQNHKESTYYPKPTLEDIRINWQTMSAAEIERLCRACNPWNKGAITTLNNMPIKLVEVETLKKLSNSEKAGLLVKRDNSSQLAIATLDGRYLIVKIAHAESHGFYSESLLFEIGLRGGMTLI